MTTSGDQASGDPAFAWKRTFCEEWQILGGLVLKQAELWNWASLLFREHADEDPRTVAQSEYFVAQSASPD